MLLRYQSLYVCLMLLVAVDVAASVRRITPRINKSTLLGSVSISHRNFSSTPTSWMKVTPKLHVYKPYMPVEDAQKLLKVSDNLTFKELNDKSFVESQKVQQAYQQGAIKHDELEAMMRSLKDAYEMLHGILKASADYKEQLKLNRDRVSQPQDMQRQDVSVRMQQRYDVDRQEPWRYQQDWVAHEQMHNAYQGNSHSFTSEPEHVSDYH